MEEASSDWIRAIDDEYGQPYWFNVTTGEARWEMEVPQVEEEKVKGVFDQLEESDEGDEAAMGHPASNEGDEQEMEEIFNELVGSNQQTELAWQQLYDSETNSPYYWNSVTNQVQWDKPQEISFESNANNVSNNEDAEDNEQVEEPVSDLLQSDQERLQQKLERMKKTATVLRSVSDDFESWVEYQGANEGPIFYARTNSFGGQWTMPDIFESLNTFARPKDTSTKLSPIALTASKTNSSPPHSSKKIASIDSTSPSIERSQPPTIQIAPNDSSGTQNRRESLIDLKLQEIFNIANGIESLQKPAKASKPPRSPSAGSEHPSKSSAKKISTEARVLSLDDVQMSSVLSGTPQSEDGSVRIVQQLPNSVGLASKLSNNNNNKQTNTRGMISKSLKFPNALLMDTIQDSIFTETFPSPSSHLQQKKKVLNISRKNPQEELDSDEEELIRFDANLLADIDTTDLLDNAIVIRQVWPWTCLVNMDQNKILYKNELTGEVQLEEPDEMVSEPNEETSGAPKGMKSLGETGLEPNISFQSTKEELLNRRKKALKEKQQIQSQQILESSAADDRAVPLSRTEDLLNYSFFLKENSLMTSPSGRDGSPKFLSQRNSPQFTLNSTLPFSPTTLRQPSTTVELSAWPAMSVQRARRLDLMRQVSDNWNEGGLAAQSTHDVSIVLASTTPVSRLKALTQDSRGMSMLMEDKPRVPYRQSVSVFSNRRSQMAFEDYWKAVKNGMTDTPRDIIDSKLNVKASRIDRENRHGECEAGSNHLADDDCNELLSRLRKLSQISSTGGVNGKGNDLAGERNAKQDNIHGITALATRAATGTGKRRHKKPLEVRKKERQLNQSAKIALSESNALGNTIRFHERMRQLMHDISDVFDETGEYGCRRTGSSPLEDEMNRRFLLEAAVLQRSKLVTPFTLREAKTMPSLPLVYCCPQALKPDDFDSLLSIEMNELMTWTVDRCRDWKIYSPISAQISSDHLQRSFYCNISNGVVQSSMPFDLLKRNQSKVLKAELMNDFEAFLCEKANFEKIISHQIEILTDEDNGLVFYDKERDVYSGTITSIHRLVAPRMFSNLAAPSSIDHQRVAAEKSGLHSNSDPEHNVRPPRLSQKTSKLRFDTHAISAARERRETRSDILHPHLNVWTTIFFDPRLFNKTWNDAIDDALQTQGALQDSNISFLGEPEAFEDIFATTTATSTNSPGKRKKKTSRFQEEDAKIQDFEKLLKNVVDDGRASQVLRDCERYTGPLSFERAFTESQYTEYSAKVLEIAKNAQDVNCILELSLWFLLRGLGRQATICVRRVSELLRSQEIGRSDYTFFRLLLLKLRFRYEKVACNAVEILELMYNCPESSRLLSQAAICLLQTHAERDAERLVVASLVIDPNNPTALRVLSHILLQRGLYSTAQRYLSRIGATSVFHSISKTELAWVNELRGVSSEGIKASYKASIALCKHDRATALTLCSIGHFYHVRGDLDKAEQFYKRSLQLHQTNAVALLLYSCLCSASKETIEGGSSAPDSRAAEADAMFRRGLLFLPRSASSWIAYLAHADAVLCNSGDIHRAQILYWESVQLSMSTSVWPTIALAQFYQYYRGDVIRSFQLLKWSCRRRKDRFQKSTYPDDDWSQEFEKSILSDPDDVEFVESLAEYSANQIHDGQNAAVIVCLSYCYIDLNQLEEAERCANAAIKIDSKFGPAHRCLAYITLRRLNSPAAAMQSLKVALSCSPQDSFVLRSYAVLLLMENKFAMALKLMIEAIACGESCSLAWRLLALITYLHLRDIPNCVRYLQRSIELSRRMDVESIRLLGQLYLESGSVLEARRCFQEALRIQPRDALTIASLAQAMIPAISAKEKKTPSKGSGGEVDLGGVNVIECTDASILFQVAVNVGLKNSTDRESRLVANSKSSASKARKIADELGQSLKSTAEGRRGGGGVSTFSLSYEFGSIHEDNNSKLSMDASEELDILGIEVPPDVLYWYGMYHLQQQGSPHRAKEIFLRAVQRVDSVVHPLALYMLGWIEESQGNYVEAEKYYKYGVLFEPFDAIQFLRLFAQIKETLREVARRTEELEKQVKLISKSTLSTKTSQALFSTIFDQLVPDGETQVNTMKSEYLEMSAKYEVVMEQYLSSKRQLLLHEKILQVAKTRKVQMAAQLTGLKAPSRLVSVDAFWKEKFYHAFCQCEDWSTLLRQSWEYRKEEKKES